MGHLRPVDCWREFLSRLVPVCLRISSSSLCFALENRWRRIPLKCSVQTQQEFRQYVGTNYFVVHHNVTILFWISEKHLGTTDVIHVLDGIHNVVAFRYFGCVFITVPRITALMVAALRWSPIMLPRHILGDKYELMNWCHGFIIVFDSSALLEWQGRQIGGFYCCKQA